MNDDILRMFSEQVKEGGRLFDSIFFAYAAIY